MSSYPFGQGRLGHEPMSPCAGRPHREEPAAHNLLQIRLRALDIREALALLAGSGKPGAGLRWHPEYPMSETVDALQMVLAAHRGTGWSGQRTPAWWLHQIVADDEVVGDVGFHGPPPATGPREVEIGYNVVEARRGRGIATRACVLALTQAWRDGASGVRADTDRDNLGSQRVLLRAGFAHLGEHRYAVVRPVGEAAG